ncbi:MAG: c-type cytochrome [Burkholderiales bacterium]|nr:c-type cytochrome [Burkholderiales bacterium]
MKLKRVRAAVCALIAAGFTSFATAQSSDDDARLKAYGKRLSSQCTNCHRIEGSDDRIPSIAGWPTEEFIFVLKAYRDGGRAEPTMAAGAHRLDENQMKALASYFGSLKPSGPRLR